MQNAQKTVLIVDDIPFVRKTLKQILINQGYRVVGEAENGEEAIQLYHETKPNLVTMDLIMPIMNGVEATKKILQSDPAAIIVILSGMMQENLVTEAIIAGAKDYITPKESQRRLSERLASSEYIEIPAGPHNVQIDFGEYVCLKVEDSLKRRSFW